MQHARRLLLASCFPPAAAAAAAREEVVHLALQGLEGLTKVVTQFSCRLERTVRCSTSVRSDMASERLRRAREATAPIGPSVNEARCCSSSSPPSPLPFSLLLLFFPSSAAANSATEARALAPVAAAMRRRAERRYCDRSKAKVWGTTTRTATAAAAHWRAVSLLTMRIATAAAAHFSARSTTPTRSLMVKCEYIYVYPLLDRSVRNTYS